MKMAEIKAEFEKYIVLKDKHVIEMVLASIVGNLLIDRDPLWLFIVAPSSGGKSTVVAPIVSIPLVHFVDDLTEKTFLSGYKVKGREMSLLKIIGSGILAFSDFTSILAKNPMSRGEILGQLRLVYDGIFIKRTGTGSIEWRGKMGVIAACTPDIYSLLESSRSAGERFIFYWMEQPTDDEIVDKQQQLKISSKEITSIMKEMYQEYYQGVSSWIDKNDIPELKMTDEQRQKVRRAAIFCVNGKTTVRTDFKTGKPDAIPNKAGVGRDAKMFDTVLHTLQIMNCYEHDDSMLGVEDWMVDVVEKCAYSSINRERRKIMEILAAHDSPMSASDIGACEGLGMEKDSVEKYLQPLHSVGLVKKKMINNRFQWFVADEETRDFVEKVSGMVADQTPAAGLEDDSTEEEDELDLLEEFYRESAKQEE